ncbi:MAG: Rdx family protein [Rhodanobacteraceae bacterium]
MASRLVADVIRDFEPQLSSLSLRPFDDGRFVVRVDGRTIYDLDRSGRFPKYEQDIKPKLAKEVS